MKSSSFLLSGTLAGTITSVIFILLHFLFIADIFFILPVAIILGALTGGCLAWAYLRIFNSFDLQNLTKFLALFSIPMILVDLVTLFSEKTYSFEELVESQTLPPDFLARVIFPIIPIVLLSGIAIGWYFGKDRKAVIPAISANVMVLIGIGHNVPFINMVSVDNLVLFLEIKLFFYLILIIMVIVYGITLVILERSSLSYKFTLYFKSQDSEN
ncbi:MAG: hypothetical protein ACFFE8_11780 [Candidatus Heimdallarchaeota archaeon]